MADLIDLSIAIRHGDGRLGLEVGFETPYRLDEVGWAGSTFSMFCHYGTHVDAPSHFIAGGAAIDEFNFDLVMGDVEFIDLSFH